MIIKRLFDIIASLCGLLLIWWIFPIVAFLIHCKMPGGPAFFTCHKFRSMTVKHSGSSVSVAGDSRITPFGAKLRHYKIDELPELWDVLIGNMSFVGPRPERRYFIDLIRKENPDYDYIYLMRPGLTSMATLYNGYTDSMQKMLIRLQMDLEYLQQRSLFLDVKIVLTTIVFILKGKKF